MAATSSGPGIADLPVVALAPMRTAYSGSMASVLATPPTAICQSSRKAARTARETMPARSEREAFMAQPARLIAKEFRYSSGFAGSKTLPITEKDFDVAVGGVRPASFISLAASVAR